MKLIEQLAEETARNMSAEAYNLYRKSGVDSYETFYQIILSVLQEHEKQVREGLSHEHGKDSSFSQPNVESQPSEDIGQVIKTARAMCEQFQGFAYDALSELGVHQNVESYEHEIRKIIQPFSVALAAFDHRGKPSLSQPSAKEFGNETRTAMGQVNAQTGEAL